MSEQSKLRETRHRAMWKWLAENPTKEKVHWPGWVSQGGRVEDVEGALCMACDEAAERKTDLIGDCSLCPVRWGTKPGGNLSTCGSNYRDNKMTTGIFGNWRKAIGDNKRRTKLANAISKLPWRH